MINLDFCHSVIDLLHINVLQYWPLNLAFLPFQHLLLFISDLPPQYFAKVLVIFVFQHFIVRFTNFISFKVTIAIYPLLPLDLSRSYLIEDSPQQFSQS